MKLEFVKETKADGTVYYYTLMNGTYVNDSIKMDEDRARKVYDRLKNGVVESKVEVLESYQDLNDSKGNGRTDIQSSEILA